MHALHQRGITFWGRLVAASAQGAASLAFTSCPLREQSPMRATPPRACNVARNCKAHHAARLTQQSGTSSQ